MTSLPIRPPAPIPSSLQALAPIPPRPPQPPVPGSVRCSGCSKVLLKGQTAFQRKGSTQLFCSTVCLTGHLPPANKNRSCFQCNREILQPRDMITIPADDSTYMHFCGQFCLSVFRHKKKHSDKIPDKWADKRLERKPEKPPEKPVERQPEKPFCSVCRVTNRQIEHEVTHQGRLHRLCSDACFLTWRKMRHLAMNCCESCGLYCNSNSGSCQTLTIERSPLNFCSPTCVGTYKQTCRKMLECAYCRKMAIVSSTIMERDQRGKVQLYCSPTCVEQTRPPRHTLTGTPFPCCLCKVSAVPQYHLAMVDGTIRNFCSYDCVSAYRKSGHPSHPDLSNGTSSLRDPSLKDAPKPGPSAGASSVPPIPQDYPSSVPYPGHHPSHTSVPPLVPPYPAMSSPSVPGQAQAKAPSGQPLKPTEGGHGDASKLTCHQCSKQFNTKPLLFSHQGRISMFCGKTCCEQHKTQKNILALCECCKQEKVPFDTVSYNQQDLVFCSESCKLLFKHDLTSRNKDHPWRPCTYCSGISQKMLHSHYGGRLEEFCRPHCMSQFTVLYYGMGRCDSCRKQGYMTEKLQCLGSVRNFCNLPCLLQYCYQHFEPSQHTSSNGTGRAPQTPYAPTQPHHSSKMNPVIADVVSLANGSATQPWRKHAVLCQQKLEQRLEAQHRSLQRTLNELKEYQKQHDHYLRQQEALDKHKLLQEEQILRNIIHETQMAKEAQLGNHQMCRLGQQQRSLYCPFDLPVRYHRGDLFEHVHYVQFGEEVSVASSVALVSERNSNQTAASPQLHPSVSGDQDPAAALWGSHQDYIQDIQRMLWPQRTDCAHEYPSVPPAHLLPTYYLPPETQALSPVATLLYGKTSPPETVALPDCGPIPQPYPALLPASLDWPLEEKELPDPFASQILQLRSGGWTLEQIGSRLAQAMKQATIPRWQVHNEAALFWRAKGNGSRALQCLRQVLSSAPPSHRHLPLTNAANLLLHHGLTTHAQTLLEQALALNASEPHTLLSLVSVQLAQGNVTGALALFRHILVMALSSSSSFSSFAGCEQCRTSLSLLRCLQFYPFLYNLSHRPCSEGAACMAEDDLGIQLEEWEGSEEKQDAPAISAMEDSLLFEKVILDSNGSGEAAGQHRASPSASGTANMATPFGGGGVEGEEEWQLKEDLMGAFEGALDVGGKRGDLRGIRVLKNDRVMGARAGGGPCFGNCEDDEGAEWITFQVKRVRKAKVDGTENVASSDDSQNGESVPGGHSVLEISGPTIPSPGPSGRWRDYTSLGWPGPEECQRTRRVDLTTVASTWLAVSAKNIDITEHIDFATPLQEPAAEPLCNANLAASMHTLDHLAGVANRAAIHYTGESQLREVLQNLGKDKFSPQSFEQVGTRIAKVLEKNQTSWVLSSMAALYWRVKGQGKRAIDCLRQALNYAPHHMKDVPLISLANIFQNARLWEDALTVARMAVEIAPHFVVNHFTLANVYIAMEEFEKAMRWYESTLKLQPEFAPAKDRLRTIQCYLLTKRERRQP